MKGQMKRRKGTKGGADIRYPLGAESDEEMMSDT